MHKVKSIDRCAVIKISGDKMHLEMSFNSDASEPIQIERYGDVGWWFDKSDPKLVADFWDEMCEENGRVCGGIYLDDGNSFDEIHEILNRYKRMFFPSDIKNLTDGEYLIYA